MVLSTLKKGLLITSATAVVVFLGTFLLGMFGLWGIAAATAFTLALASLLHVLIVLRTKMFETQTIMFIDMTVIFFVGGGAMVAATLELWVFIIFLLFLGYYAYQHPEIFFDTIFS